MSKSTIYKIKVTNWTKYNKNQKRTHKSTMIANNFTSDAKVCSLPVSIRWMFLGLILECGSTAQDSCELTERQLQRLLEKGSSVPRALQRLQSLQLLSYEKLAPTVQDSTVRDRTVQDSTSRRGERIQPAQAELIPKENAPRSPKPATPNTGLVIAAYCDAWRKRYNAKSSPQIRPQDSKNLRVQLVESAGVEKAIAMIEAYLSMPDQWFITKRHDIPTFLNSLNAVTHFLETGKVLTRKDVQRVEEKSNTQNLLTMVEEGKI